MGGDVTINGNGHKLIGENHKGITVGADTHLTLKNLTWTGEGRPIINDGGTLTITDTKFHNISFQENSQIWGGVIRNINAGVIDQISRVSFDGNKITGAGDKSDSVWGGLINNGFDHYTGSDTTRADVYINSINYSSFTNNYIYSSKGAPHGAIILNVGGSIGSIEHNLFENNTMTSAPDQTGGGHGVAIDNNGGGYIGTIANNTFKNNKTYRTGEQEFDSSINYHASGGAIDNYGRIDNLINNTFEGNAAESVASHAGHGAIMNNPSGADDFNGYKAGSIGVVSGNKFINNHASSVKAQAYSGAGSFGDVDEFINNTFTGNYASSVENYAYGGAMYLVGTIDKFDGNTFVGNKVLSEKSYAVSGVLFITNTADIKSISNTKFIDNFAQGGDFGRGGAIYLEGNIGNITNSKFINNIAQGVTGQSSGGAIYVYPDRKIGDLINVDFEGNKAISKEATSSVLGGAVVFRNTGNLTNVNFINNESISDEGSSRGGAMFVGGNIGNFNNVLFEGNSAKGGTYARGGALFLTSGSTIGEIKNSSFINNTVEGDETSNGGAIYSTNSDISIAADKGSSVFKGNTVNGVSNAIYMETADTNLNLRAVNNGVITFGDAIDGAEDGYNLNISGDTSGKIVFDENIAHAAITQEAVTTVVAEGKYLGNDNSVLMKSGVMQIGHLGLEPVSLKKLTLTGGQIDISSVDVDLAEPSMGRLETDDFVAGSGKITVQDFNILTDSEELETVVNFASEDMKGSVEGGNGTADGRIYTYQTSYDADTGNFSFVRGAGDKISDFNKELFSGDIFGLSALFGQELILQNAVAEYDDIYKYHSGGRFWALPYYQTADLDWDDFEAKNENIGFVFGADSKALPVVADYRSVLTVYGGFNGGTTKVDDLKVKDNALSGGVKASLFNHRWYNDLIAQYTYHDGEARRGGNKYSLDTNGYGLAWKGGFKTMLGNSPFELDGNVMLSWHRLDGTDYTTSKGVLVQGEDYERTTVSPMLKLGYRVNGIMPYAYARYNYILNDKGSSRVDAVELPTISGKDYVDAGIGVRSVQASPHILAADVSRMAGGADGWRLMLSYSYRF